MLKGLNKMFTHCVNTIVLKQYVKLFWGEDENTALATALIKVILLS